MIIVKIELHSAITGKVKLIGTMRVVNAGSSINPNLGDYGVELLRRGSWTDLSPEETRAAIVRRSSGRTQRQGSVIGHTRLSAPVWTLIRKAIQACGF